MADLLGVFAPAGTPRDIVTRLNAEIVGMVQSPEVIGQFAKQGLEVFGSTPEQFAARIKSDIVKRDKVVKDTRATVD